MTTSLMADAFGHHVWATLTLLDTCLELDDAPARDRRAGDVRLDPRDRATHGRGRPRLPVRADRRRPRGDRRGLDVHRRAARIDGRQRPGLGRPCSLRTSIRRSMSSGTATTGRTRMPSWASASPRSSTMARTIEARSARRSRPSASRRPRSMSGTTPGRTSASGRRRRPPDGHRRTGRGRRRRQRPPTGLALASTLSASAPDVAGGARSGAGAVRPQPGACRSRLLRILRGRQ